MGLRRLLGIKRRRDRVFMPAEDRKASADYYDMLHRETENYRERNWLIEELEILRRLGGNSFLELGCGNGRFLSLAADHWKQVVGLDWARSPQIDEILRRHGNVRFVKADLLTVDIEQKFDVAASADVLEHLPESALARVIENMHNWAPINFHKIACYDDKHSHLSILPPERWLSLFRTVDERYYLRSVTVRRNNPNRLVAVITNGVPAD